MTAGLTPRDPRAGRQRSLTLFLRATLVGTAALAGTALVLPGRGGRAIAIAMVGALVLVPVVRIGWLAVRWARKGDYRFTGFALVLLAVIAAASAAGR